MRKKYFKTALFVFTFFVVLILDVLASGTFFAFKTELQFGIFNDTSIVAFYLFWVVFAIPLLIADYVAFVVYQPNKSYIPNINQQVDQTQIEKNKKSDQNELNLGILIIAMIFAFFFGVLFSGLGEKTYPYSLHSIVPGELREK